MSQLHVSQEMLYNCMASLANTAAQRPSRRIEPVEVLIKLKKCDKKEYEHFTSSVRLKHSPKPCFRVCIVGGEQAIREAAANQLDFLDLPTLKEIGKVPAVARVLAKKYDAFLVSKPLLSQFNAYLGYAVVGEHKAPVGFSPEQSMMAKIKEVENTAKIRLKACCRDSFSIPF
ncbi:large ribosomal subunit protein uL1-like [Dermacentor andersoni]|uniref:large ribosomal subunit protein uL1-like n=1 Tax=Dermacentor andersoni TaxID=34620 RepID=UPI00241655AB|nr:60S ribosomal protein L10a-2-like [Dermacentor andersoni]